MTPYVDVFEFRADTYQNHSAFQLAIEMQKFSDLPSLLTVRSKEESKPGQGWQGSEGARIELIHELLPYSDAVDVELAAPDISSVIRDAHSQDVSVVGSYHNFDITPDRGDLEEILESSLELDADYCKIATSTKSPEDLHILSSFLMDHTDDNLIIVGMDQLGPRSRIILPFLGSLMTYAAADENPLASGQMGYKQTRQLLDMLSL